MGEFDTLSLRNRDVVETLSPLKNLGQDRKEEIIEEVIQEGEVDEKEEESDDEKEYDELELRNRTVTETLSPIEDLGQNVKESSEEGSEEDEEEDTYDTLSLRKRDVTEIFSPVADLGQDKPEEPSPKKPKFE